ncbi:MAG TPA: NAD(P)H-hydrate dehydratase, partial [Thermoleophilaceae bacterium]|nr:NAD(P)H-hydrate dehydratase [Thermoleophilaceae bacterium]
WEAGEMRAADKHAIEEAGVPSLDLMERAGAGLARAVAEVAGDGPIRVVIGKGNNGGDGLVAARLLREDGYDVDVLAAGNPDELRGDARANLDRLPGRAPGDFDPARLEGSAAIVDAMLGTGFEGEPREPVAGAIKAINAVRPPGGASTTPVVVACDIASGVNASTGEVSGDAVEADVTATFHGPKVGLYVEPGKTRSGRVAVVEIGIPRSAPPPAAAGLISERVLQLVPRRARSGNKFTSGTVVVAGGARGLTGAPTMAALSAMRTGAGYVQLAVPEPAETVIDLRLMEAMTHALPHRDGAHVEEGAEQVIELSKRAGAIVLGPGLGRTDGAVAFAHRVARDVKVPLLVDADGLNAHAQQLGLLAQREAPTIVTPHDGELARLLGIESAAVGERRIAHARAVAEQSGAIVVLKGDDTLVVPPKGPIAISAGSTPALATAGTGDVLSGVIGALLAKRMDPFAAACAGVFAHARAGRAAAARYGADHVVAGDVIDALPDGFRRPDV